MQKRMHRFTLVEMLTVIAIISILAGLIIPVVVIAQERGRETQAKSDIAALMSALKQVETDYGRILKKDGSNYKMGDKTLSASDEEVGSGNDAIKTKKITFFLSFFPKIFFQKKTFHFFPEIHCNKKKVFPF